MTLIPNTFLARSAMPVLALLLIMAPSSWSQGFFPPPDRTPPNQFPSTGGIHDPLQPNRVPAPKYNLGVLGSFTPQGMLLTRIVPNTPAARAGLKAGDLIIKLDNVAVRNQQQFVTAIRTSGGSVQLVVQRRLVPQPFRVLVDLTNNGCGRVRAPYVLGILSTYTAQGMLVRKVYEDTPAAQVGLKVGDLVLRINNEIVLNEQTFFQVLSESAGNALIDVRRGARQARLKARMPLYRFGSLGNFFGAGNRIELVTPNTPATSAGFQPGDILTAFDNVRLGSNQAFNQALDQCGGTVIVQTVRRVGGAGRLKVNVINNSLGCWCEPVRGGMRILTVQQGGMAQRLGLARGDIVFQIDNRRTASLAQMQGLLENARGLMTLDYRSGFTRRLQRLNIDLGG